MREDMRVWKLCDQIAAAAGVPKENRQTPEQMFPSLRGIGTVENDEDIDERQQFQNWGARLSGLG
jgi:hypothetical protein